MKFCYNTNSTLPKQCQSSRSVLKDGSRTFGLFWKEKNPSYNRRNTVSVLWFYNQIHRNFLLKKCEKLCTAKASHIFSTKNIGIFEILMFAILTKFVKMAPPTMLTITWFIFFSKPFFWKKSRLPLVFSSPVRKYRELLLSLWHCVGIGVGVTL